MTATERLRELLDERGIEYAIHPRCMGTAEHVEWRVGDVAHVAYCQPSGLYLQLSKGPLTPEQAIAATLGPED